MDNAYPEILGRNFLNPLSVRITFEPGKAKVGTKEKEPVSGIPLLLSKSPQDEATEDLWTNEATEDLWINEATEDLWMNETTEDLWTNEATEDLWMNEATEDLWTNEATKPSLDEEPKPSGRGTEAPVTPPRGRRTIPSLVGIKRSPRRN